VDETYSCRVLNCEHYLFATKVFCVQIVPEFGRLVDMSDVL
jgi:hypothetical protein